MHVLRASQYQRMPWKNGGGETFEIAISPPQAGFDTLDWRVSMALVTQDGPFSMLPQIDRTLCVLDGPGLDLDFGEGGGTQRVTPATPPLSFPADRAVHARILGGPITDLNVMTRRGRYRHAVRRVAPNGTYAPPDRADQLLAFCEHGEVRIVLANGSACRLGARDGVLMDARSAQGLVRIEGADTEAASVCMIELYRMTA